MLKKTSVEKHFDKIALDYDYYKKKNVYYYQNLKKLLADLIPENRRVFEIGCGTGDILVSLRPKAGYGMDISSKMIEIAKDKYRNNKNLIFSTQWPKESFDFIFMSDVIEHLEKPDETFSAISKLMDRNTIFINTMANPLWEPFLMNAEKFGLKMPEGPHRRIGNEELRIMYKKTGLKIMKHDYRLLIPIQIPVVSDFVNRYIEKYLKKISFIEFFVARKIRNP